MKLTISLVAAAALGAACGDKTKVRTVGKPSSAPTTSQPSHRNPAPGPGGAIGNPGATGNPARQLNWQTPEGWQQLQPTSFRAANFKVQDGDKTAECYLTLLPGQAGGLLANINRWRNQLQTSILTVTDLAKLRRRKFFGQDATFVDFAGSWNGKPDHRLVGLLLCQSSGSRFLKMVGPKDLIEDQLQAFHALAASMSMGGDVDSTGRATGGGLSWQAPKTWRRGQKRTMRLANYIVGPDGARAECYITVLAGNGGGPGPNANRWRTQMGQPRYSIAEFQKVPRLQVLGGEAFLIEAIGTFRGMSGEVQKEATLLGVIRSLPRQAVFVKMIGPRATVEAAKQEFVNFCKSLRVQ